MSKKKTPTLNKGQRYKVSPDERDWTEREYVESKKENGVLKHYFRNELFGVQSSDENSLTPWEFIK